MPQRPFSFVFILLTACGGLAISDGSLNGDAGDSIPPRGRKEVCNGIDDDADGKVDEGCPIRLTTSPLNDFNPSLSGNRVAWVREGADRKYSILTRELPAGPERVVATDANTPSLSGNRVVYAKDRRVVVIDLATNKETTIEISDADWAHSVTIDGERVAWSQLKKGTEEDYEVVVYELDSQRRYVVGSDPAIQQYPRLRGNTLVWTDDRHGHHTHYLSHLNDVYTAELGAIAPPLIRRITQRSGERQYDNVNAVDPSRVLAVELDGILAQGPYLCRPVMFDLKTGARTELTPSSYDCNVPHALSGDRAIIEYEPLGRSDLYLHNLRTGSKLQLTNYARRSTRARLEGNTLVWQDDRNDTWDLYMMDLSDVDAGDLSPEGVTP